MIKKIMMCMTYAFVSVMALPLNVHADDVDNDCTAYAMISESNSTPLSIYSNSINIDGLVYSNSSIDSTIKIENQRNRYPAEHSVTNFSSDIMKFDKELENHESDYSYYGDVNVVNAFGLSSISAADSNLLVDEMFGANENVTIYSGIVSNAFDDQDSIIFSSNGNISIYCSVFDFDGIIYAPNGTVTLNANDVDIYGLIVAREIKIQSESFDIISNQNIFEKYDIEFYTLGETPTNIDIMAAKGSATSSWYNNTGTALQTKAVYSKYNLLKVVKVGDIIHESRSFTLSQITGHVACVEGVYYLPTSSRGNTYMHNIRVIEAIPSGGVCRGILDDTRCDDNNVILLRYTKNLTQSQISNVLYFLRGQLGKKYFCDGSRNYAYMTIDWYCSELVWAAYKYIGLDIEDGDFGFITPGDILDTLNTKKISYK